MMTESVRGDNVIEKDDDDDADDDGNDGDDDDDGDNAYVRNAERRQLIN